MKPDPLAEYLSDCRSRHKTGALTPETSLYQPLETLLSAVGATLKPKVRCFMNMKNQGSGMPDGGLFTPDQFDKDAADALRQDWPRVPLPRAGDRLAQSAALGRQLAALLDPEAPVPGVTQGAIRPELRVIAPIQKVGGGQLDPTKDCTVTVRWGVAGKGGICMPGKGKALDRAYSEAEAKALGAFTAQLGDGTFDIYLNGVAYWRNVPEKVWEYTLGGYQVLKKWLSYRETALLGRSLTLDEVEYFTKTCRRIAAILLLGPELDANYEKVCDDLYPWPAPL